MMNHDAERILKERARALARPPREAAPAAGEPLLVFRLADTRAALPLAVVHRVQPFEGYARVPCVPPFVLGALSLQDRVWAVLDLRERLDIAPSAEPPAFALLLEPPERCLGIAVDDVETICHPAPEELPEGEALAGAPYVRGVTTGGILVLEPARILEDPSLVVREEVEAR